jgi:hypothetical protein
MARDLALHVSPVMMGHFKARSNAIKKIVVPMAAVTASGLEPGIWGKRLVDVLEECGITLGWLFQDRYGNQRRMASFGDKFYRVLFAIRDRNPELFEPDIDIMEEYQMA